MAAEKEKFLQEKLSQNNQVAETPKVVVTETPKVVINSTPIQKPIVSTVSSQESIGFKTQSEMLATHGSAIQLGAYLNPNWNLINQFTELGKIVSFKNDKGLNVVWITGFNSRSEADLTLQKVRSKAGFQNAIALGK
ncbi:MAG: hypothetical protein IPL21_08995 [Saprospirales bacterium]|nr:hypothetical protein [Saprospirales bacterium]